MKSRALPDGLPGRVEYSMLEDIMETKDISTESNYNESGSSRHKQNSKEARI